MAPIKKEKKKTEGKYWKLSNRWVYQQQQTENVQLP